MKLILIMVTSLDGRSTKGSLSDNHVWTSPEDQEHFQNVLENASLIIMGSKTYEAARDGGIEHKDGRLRVIITRTPEKYESEKIPGKLEFTNENPKELINRLESKGYATGYLVGGANTNTQFFKQNLVTELWQTVEPKILGKGNGIISEEETEISLELIESKKLNDKGTLLLKYKITN